MSTSPGIASVPLIPLVIEVRCEDCGRTPPADHEPASQVGRRPSVFLEMEPPPQRALEAPPLPSYLCVKCWLDGVRASRWSAAASEVRVVEVPAAPPEPPAKPRTSRKGSRNA
jgi:hypothetical protein